MSESEKRLLSLLFEEGRVLENLKFFPGPNCTSEEQLFEAAHDAIKMALADKGGDRIPVEKRKPIAIGDFVNSI